MHAELRGFFLKITPKIHKNSRPYGENLMTRKRRIPFTQTFMLDVLFDKKARPFFIYILINVIFGAAIFHWLEGWEWLDSFYFVVITITTIGYGDFSPTTPLTKLFTIFYSINGVIMLLFLFDLVRKVRGWQHGISAANEDDIDSLPSTPNN